MSVTRKLVYKLTVLAIVPVILSMVLFGSVSYYIFKEKLVQERIEEAKSLIDLSSKEISNPLYFLDLNKLNDIIQNLKNNPNVLSVYIMDSNGRVITDGTIENRFYNQTLEDDLSKRSIHSSEMLSEIKNGTLQVSAPAVINKKIGIIRMDFSLKELDQVLLNLIILLFIIGAAIFVGVAAVDVLISRSISRPVTDLRDAALEIAKGNFDTRMELRSEDEIGELAAAFNKMASDLRRSHDSITSAKEYTDNIMRSMSDTLIVVSQEGIIKTVNPEACSLLGYGEEELIGRHFSTVLADKKEPQFNGPAPDDLIKRGTIRNVERTYLAKGSKKIPVVFSASVMHDGGGRVQGIVCVARDITERKMVEKLIKESEERYRNLVELTTDIIYISDKEGNQVFMNDAGYRMLEASPEEVLDQPWQKWIYPDDRERSFKKFMEMVERGIDIFGFENRYVSKSGRVIDVLHNIRVLRDEKGEITGTQGIARDITERKRAEVELLKFKLGIERSDEAIFITSIDGTIIYINPAFGKIYGFGRDEALGKTPRILKSGLLPSEAYKPFWDTLLSKKVVTGELINKTRDGKLLNIEGSANPILNERGDIIGFLAIQRDITGRKRIEEELKIKAQLLDAATDSIFVHDLDGNFIYLNEAAHRSRGYTREELMNIGLNSIVTPEYGRLIRQRTKELVEKGEVVFESADITKDRSVIPVEVHASIIESGGIKLVLSVARDITERKWTEELLKEKARAELYGFIVSALPVFAAGVPSQVRNTLVKNFAERFEKNILPRFHEEMERLRHGVRAGDNGSEAEMLDTYMAWLQGLFSNFGIRSREFPVGEKRCLEFLNCPWIGEAKGNPIFCFICRTIVIRSLTWTELKGNADQSASIANGSPTCRFEVHV